MNNVLCEAAERMGYRQLDDSIYFKPIGFGVLCICPFTDTISCFYKGNNMNLCSAEQKLTIPDNYIVDIKLFETYKLDLPGTDDSHYEF